MRHILFPTLLLLSVSAVLAAPPSLQQPEQLSLSAAEQAMLDGNRDLRAARRAVSGAEAGLRSADTRPNPTLTLGASNIDTQRGIGSGGLRDKQVDRLIRLDQPIERGNKHALRVATAGALQRAAQSDLADTERLQLLALRQAYFDLKLAEARLAAARESATLAQDVLKRTELRYQAGDLSGAEKARILTDAARSEGDARQAEMDLSRARLALAQLMAQETQAQRLHASDPWPDGSTEASPGADAPARPDIAAARERVGAAETAVEQARALRSRDLSVGAQFELDPRDGRHLLSLGVSVPLFVGNDYQGEELQALNQLDLARDDLARLEATARAECEQAALLLHQSVLRAKQMREEALPAAQKAYRAARFAFDQGAASALDLVDARRALLAAETDTAAAEADAAKARAQWAAAMNLKELP